MAQHRPASAMDQNHHTATLSVVEDLHHLDSSGGEERSLSTTENSHANEVEFFLEPKSWSKVKHQILDQYLKAWVAIFAQQQFSNMNIVYIDGFAGCGLYDDGTLGSPLLALQAVEEHSMQQNFKRKIHMIFIESNPTSVENLRQNLDAHLLVLVRAEKYYPHVTYDVIQGEFATVMEEILTKYPIEAMFAFVDPFGFNGSVIPMDLMQRILARPAPTDIFINIMIGSIVRFMGLDNRAKAVNELMGTDTWKSRIPENGSPEERRMSFMNVYTEQLQQFSSPLYTLQFAMRNHRNRYLYYLVFAAKHVKAFTTMKYVMWMKTQEKDEFVYSDWKENNVLETNRSLTPAERRKVLAVEIMEIILDEFAGDLVRGATLERFIEESSDLPFTAKNELKKLLKPYFADPKDSTTKAFERITFRFPCLTPQI